MTSASDSIEPCCAQFTPKRSLGVRRLHKRRSWARYHIKTEVSISLIRYVDRHLDGAAAPSITVGSCTTHYSPGTVSPLVKRAP